MADVLLTLVVPESLAPAVADLLLTHPDLAEGFTIVAAQAHGMSVKLITQDELVAGHAPRSVIQSTASERSAGAVLALLRQAFSGAGLYYWLTPILDKGHL